MRFRSTLACLLAALCLTPAVAAAETDLETIARETLPEILFESGQIGSIDIAPQGADALKATYSNVVIETNPEAGEAIRIKSLSMRVQTIDDNLVRISKVQLANPIELLESGAAVGTLAIELRNVECDLLLAQETCQSLAVNLPSVTIDAPAEGGLITLSDIYVDAYTEIGDDGGYETPFNLGFSNLSISEYGSPAFAMERFSMEGIGRGASYEEVPGGE